jgi:hypothetical protein
MPKCQKRPNTQPKETYYQLRYVERSGSLVSAMWLFCLHVSFVCILGLF